MGTHQMEKNIELLAEMLPAEQKKAKTPKKVFRKKKLKKTGELKKERVASKSKGKKREATTSARKKTKKKKRTKGSPKVKLVKSQSIQLLTNTGWAN